MTDLADPETRARAEQARRRLAKVLGISKALASNVVLRKLRQRLAPLLATGQASGKGMTPAVKALLHRFDDPALTIEQALAVFEQLEALSRRSMAPAPALNPMKAALQQPVAASPVVLPDPLQAIRAAG